MEQNQSKSSKKKDQKEEATHEEEPSEEEPIEEDEPIEEEPIEEEPFEEEPFEEEPIEEEPFEEESFEEEPVEENQPFEESSEEEPLEKESFEEQLIEEELLEDEEEPLKEFTEDKIKRKQVGSPPVTSKRQKCVRWDMGLFDSAAASLVGSSVTNSSSSVPKIVDAASIFVWSLPLSMDTSSLVELFTPFGRITNARVAIDKESGLSKGFGFVKFVNPAHAAKTLQCMNGHKIGSHIIHVKPKEIDGGNLVVEDLPPGVDACRLAKMFSPFGHVTDASVKTGFGFVKFSNGDHAAKAIASMNRSMVDGHSIHVRVVGSSPDQRPDPQCTTEARREIDMANLYVANLPQSFKTDGLIQLFIRFGPIEKATVVVDKVTGLSRGYGFVKFADAAHAAEAIKSMAGYILEGKELNVRKARFGKQIDEANLYVGYLPLYIKQKSLYNLFERFGPIVEANVVMDDAGVSKGYGFVRFADPAHAANAMARMNGLTIEDTEICVRVAGTSSGSAEKLTMTTEKSNQIDEANLYVSNLPPNLERSGLVKLFDRFGPVAQAKVIKDKVTGISKCFGFVRFSDVDHAAEGIKGINGYLIEGRMISVRIADPPGQLGSIDETATSVRVAGGISSGSAKKVTTVLTTEKSNQIDEANLYVSNLPPSLERSGLVKLFDRFGPVAQAKVIKDKVTGISKCSGFVRFSDAGHAAEAIKGINGFLIEGRMISVRIADPPGQLGSIDETTISVRVAGTASGSAEKMTTILTTEKSNQIDEANLYVSNLPPSLETAGLVKLFDRFGPVAQAKVIKDKVTGISKCFGFVRFSDAGHAAEAIKGMNGSLVEGRMISVKIADPPGQLGSMAAQPFPWCTFPGPWGYQHEVSATSGLWGSMPMQQYPWLYNAPASSGYVMPLHDFKHSDVIPTPDDLARFPGFRKSLDDSDSVLFGSLDFYKK